MPRSARNSVRYAFATVSVTPPVPLREARSRRRIAQSRSELAMTINPGNGPGSSSAAEWVDADSLIRLPKTPGLVGESVALQAVAAAIARVAPHKGTVLILGESGTGKELVA